MAGISTTAAHRELALIKQAGLAQCVRLGNSLVFEAQTDAPNAHVLISLLKTDEPQTGLPACTVDAAQTREALNQLGAPLQVESHSSLTATTQAPEQTIVDALILSHHDATIARILPIVLWKNRNALNLAMLVELAKQNNEADALGMFMELTQSLLPDASDYRKRIKSSLKELRDRRRTKPRSFFHTSSNSYYSRRLAERHTPAVARKWRLVMNMPLESFRTTFEKHAYASSP